MTLIKVSFLLGVGRCVDFSHFVFKRDFFVFNYFFFSFPIAKMKLNIQICGEGNNKPSLFYLGEGCYFCQLASSREPAKSSSLSFFIHWHSALRQLEVQAHRKAGLNFTCVWFGVTLLWCHCWTDQVTVGRWNGDLRELQAGSSS